jgi:hypothetical protein
MVLRSGGGHGDGGGTATVMCWCGDPRGDAVLARQRWWCWCGGDSASAVVVPVPVVAQPHRRCDEVRLEVERAFSDVPMIDRNDTNQKEKKKKSP